MPVNAQGGIVEQVRIGDDCFIGGGRDDPRPRRRSLRRGRGQRRDRAGGGLRDRRRQPGADHRRPAPVRERRRHDARILADVRARHAARTTRSRPPEIVIVSATGGRELLRACLRSLERHPARGGRPRDVGRRQRERRRRRRRWSHATSRGCGSSRSRRTRATAPPTTSPCARRPRRTCCCSIPTSLDAPRDLPWPVSNGDVCRDSPDGPAAASNAAVPPAKSSCDAASVTFWAAVAPWLSRKAGSSGGVKTMG